MVENAHRPAISDDVMNSCDQYLVVLVNNHKLEAKQWPLL